MAIAFANINNGKMKLLKSIVIKKICPIVKENLKKTATHFKTYMYLHINQSTFIYNLILLEARGG